LQNLTWHIGMQRVTLQGTATLSAPKEQFTLVDWLVPPEIAVTSVRGAEVRSWARNGPRLQIWLRRSVKEAVLELTGWLPRSAEKSGQPFALPCVNVAAASRQWTTVRILADNDVALKAGEFRHLWPAPSWRPSARVRIYFSQQTDYSAVFQVSPAQAQATARIVTVAETHGRAITFSSTIDYVQGQGEL